MPSGNDAYYEASRQSRFELRGVRILCPYTWPSEEFWRNRGPVFPVSLVIALITLLILFIDGLAEGLGAGNIEYLDKLDAELVLFQENTDLSTGHEPDRLVEAQRDPPPGGRQGRGPGGL